MGLPASGRPGRRCPPSSRSIGLRSDSPVKPRCRSAPCPKPRADAVEEVERHSREGASAQRQRQPGRDHRCSAGCCRCECQPRINPCTQCRQQPPNAREPANGPDKNGVTCAVHPGPLLSAPACSGLLGHASVLMVDHTRAVQITQIGAHCLADHRYAATRADRRHCARYP